MSTQFLSELTSLGHQRRLAGARREDCSVIKWSEEGGEEQRREERAERKKKKERSIVPLIRLKRIAVESENRSGS